MPYRRHHATMPYGLPSVAMATTVPPTQDSVAYQGSLFDKYPSNETASASIPGGILSFDGQASTAMTDIDGSYIRIRGYYLFNGADGQSIFNTTGTGEFGPQNQSVGPTQMLSCALFKDATIELNGTQVVASQGLAQPYCHLANVIKNETYDVRKSGEFDRGYLLDDPQAAAQSDRNVLQTYDAGALAIVINPDRLKRIQGFFSGKQPVPAGTGPVRPFDLKIRLSDIGLRTYGGWLPPNVRMRVQVQRHSTEFLRNGASGEVTSADPIFTVADATLFLARKNLKTTVMDDLLRVWSRDTLKLPMSKMRSNVSWLTAGAQTVNVINALAGPTPECVYAFTVPQTAILGTSNGEAPSFYTATGGGWSNATLTVGGTRTFPAQPLAQYTNSGGNVRTTTELYDMYLETVANQDSPFLTSADFVNIEPLCFQIGAAEKGTWDEAEDTSVQFNGTLNTAPFGGVAWALVLISFTPSVVEFTEAGEVVLQ